MINYVEGYKCFNEGLINRYCFSFEVDKEYHIDGDIKYQSNGFHMCKNLEDTLRYFDTFNENVDIAKVVGYGEVYTYDDEYNGFYDMYATEYIKLLQVLSRKEIINYALNLPEEQVKRFISLYKLNNDEILLFNEKFNKFNDVLMAIEYYQEHNTKVYEKKL